MSEFYKRQIQLWGEKTQKELSKKSIAIIGSGGLGCSLGLALGSSGIGTIYLVDFDTISLHNIHRQIAFKVEDEGEYKSKVLASVLQKRANEDVKIVPFVCTFDEFASKDIHVDLILDASDNLQVRSDMNAYSKKTKTPWIYASVEEYNAHVCFFDRANFNDTLSVHDSSPKGQTPPMVMQTASFSANLALRYLASLEVKKDKLYYLFFNKEGELKFQNFNLPISKS